VPVYCETGHPFWFMAEPVNTISNLVIVLAGLMAWRHVRRATGRQPPDLMILVFLLIATGLGSFAWHALRTRTALTLDWLPGVIFLLTYVFLWLRALFGPWAGALASLAVPASGAGTMALIRPLLGEGLRRANPLLFLPFFGSLATLGLAFVWLTLRKRGPHAAQSALLAIGLGLTAAFFRTIDLQTCQVLPFGTHFLWHCFLSAAAYRCVVLITQLKHPDVAA
jgi:hypothetical protein